MILHETLVDALQSNALTHTAHACVHWVDDNGDVATKLTYQQIWEHSELVSDLLLSNGVKRGDRVMIAFKFGLDFLAALFGCMKLGAIACSVRLEIVLLWIIVQDILISPRHRKLTLSHSTL